jgi:hypothetical protein
VAKRGHPARIRPDRTDRHIAGLAPGGTQPSTQRRRIAGHGRQTAGNAKHTARHRRRPELPHPPAPCRACARRVTGFSAPIGPRCTDSGWVPGTQRRSRRRHRSDRPPVAPVASLMHRANRLCRSACSRPVHAGGCEGNSRSVRLLLARGSPETMIAPPLIRAAGTVGDAVSSSGYRWLRPAIEAAALASGKWPLTPHPAPWQWTCFPRVATRTPGVDGARDPSRPRLCHRHRAAVGGGGTRQRHRGRGVGTAHQRAAPRRASAQPGPATPGHPARPGPARTLRAVRGRDRSRRPPAPSIPVRSPRPAAACRSSARSVTAGATPPSATSGRWSGMRASRKSTASRAG